MELLDFITEWFLAPSTRKENVLWLQGVAGSGKSTISTTIAQRFLTLRRRGAFLHFNRNDEVNSSPAAVIRTISHQLARFHPLIRNAICETLKAHPGLETAPLSIQFEELVRIPLYSIASLESEGPIVIVLDALDECGDARSRADVLEVLREGLAKLPPVFRILITSRKEWDIIQFLSMPNVVVQPLELSDLAVRGDIERYLHHGFDKITRRHHDLPPKWPAEGDLRRLGNLADGLFIWASTAVNFVANGDYPEDHLKALLESPTTSLRGLDDLYGLVLRCAVDWTSDKNATFYRSVLGAILVSRVPITDTILDELLAPLPHKAKSFLNRLLPLLRWVPGEPIRVLHTSFTDYLSNLKHYRDIPWFVDVAAHHQALSIGCFDLMVRELHFNICKIPTSFYTHSEIEGLAERVEQNISPTLMYATRYWVDHLEAAFRGLDGDKGD